MQETLLLFQVSNDDYEKICHICKQLSIQIKVIHKTDIHETMGYLLGIDGFISSERQDKEELLQPFLFFAGMSEQQLDILLELLKMQSVKIPYKAMLTQHNLHYTFLELYQSVEREYQEMTQNS